MKSLPWISNQVNMPAQSYVEKRTNQVVDILLSWRRRNGTVPAGLEAKLIAFFAGVIKIIVDDAYQRGLKQGLSQGKQLQAEA